MVDSHSFKVVEAPLEDFVSHLIAPQNPSVFVDNYRSVNFGSGQKSSVELKVYLIHWLIG